MEDKAAIKNLIRILQRALAEDYFQEEHDDNMEQQEVEKCPSCGHENCPCGYDKTGKCNCELPKEDVKNG
jgi:hypothetical protein